MAYGLPARGQQNWDDELNNSIEALRADVESTVSKAAVAASNAAYARNRADEVHTAVVGGTDAAVSGFIKDDTSATKVALSNTIVTGRNTPGRGRIAIELDDAEVRHFTEILPMTQKYGVPIGTAWPTSYPRDAYIADAHAAGWEIMSHAHVHQNLTTLTEAQLRADAQASVDKIAAITGRPDDIAFVYPEHQRNATTDRILSEYFTRGRGRAAWEPVPTEGTLPWLVPAVFLDPEWDGAGGMSDRVKRTLDALARSDGQMIFYFHYPTTATIATVNSMETFIRYARELGIQIVKPSELTGGRTVTPDPFLRENTGQTAWTLDAGWTLGSTNGMRGGQALKFTPAGVGGGYTSGIARRSQPVPHFSTAGKFSLFRASARYTASGPIAVAQGLAFRLSGNARAVVSADPTSIGTKDFGTKFAGSDGNIPAGTLVPISRVVAVGPDVVNMTNWIPVMISQAENTPPFYLTDIRLERIDEVSSLTFTATLNGTTGVTINTGVYAVARYGIAVTPLASTAGRIYATPGSNDDVVVKSTDATDTTQQVKVTITPTSAYADWQNA